MTHLADVMTCFALIIDPRQVVNPHLTRTCITTECI